MRILIILIIFIATDASALVITRGKATADYTLKETFFGENAPDADGTDLGHANTGWVQDETNGGTVDANFDQAITGAYSMLIQPPAGSQATSAYWSIATPQSNFYSCFTMRLLNYTGHSSNNFTAFYLTDSDGNWIGYVHARTDGVFRITTKSVPDTGWDKHAAGTFDYGDCADPNYCTVFLETERGSSANTVIRIYVVQNSRIKPGSVDAQITDGGVYDDTGRIIFQNTTAAWDTVIDDVAYYTSAIGTCP